MQVEMFKVYEQLETHYIVAATISLLVYYL